MYPIFLEAIQIGLFQIPFSYHENPFLCLCFWLCCAIGSCIQLALLLHGKSKWMRSSFLLLSLGGLLLCELVALFLTGLPLLFCILLWFFCFAFVLSAIFCTILYCLLQKYHKKK